MIKMSLTDMKEKIIKEGNILESELDSKIKIKLEQLSGLVSEEGACHIIANELGVKLFALTGGKIKVSSLMPGLRNFEIVLKITKKFEPREFSKGDRSGRVANIFAGDETGLTRIVFWNDHVDKLKDFLEGDVVLVRDGYIKENQGRNEIHLNSGSEFIIKPEGETISELAEFKKSEYTRRKLSELKEDEYNVSVLGTIVQLYEPRFFEVCPTCRKRTRMQESERFVCEEHGEITPAYSYVLNSVIDDGTESLRVSCFGEQANQLLGLTSEEVLHYKDNLSEFETLKQDVLGKIVKMDGRVKKNIKFDRIEFTAQDVDNNPNPEEELKRLNETE